MSENPTSEPIPDQHDQRRGAVGGLSVAAIEAALRAALPPTASPALPALAQMLAAVADGSVSADAAAERLAATPELIQALHGLSGRTLAVADVPLQFAEDRITLGNVGDSEGIAVGRAAVAIKLTLSPDQRQGAFVSDHATVYGPVIGDNSGTVNYTAPPPIAPSPSLHQLRPPHADFVGRAQEIEVVVGAIRAALANGAAAAISGLRGLGGIGKTELAYAVAQRLAPLLSDAQLVVELRGASEVPLSLAGALQAVIHAFEPAAQLPEDLAALQTLYRSRLSGKRVLILADDALDAAQVERLAPPAGCVLLVTSRQRFLLEGMQPVELGVLSDADATTLVLTICPRLGPDAARLTDLCGRLPLALRLSASLLANDPTLTIAEYLTRLEDEHTRLPALQDPDRPERGIAAALQVSYAALDPVAQAVLAQLGIFAASFDTGAAAAVVQVQAGAADANTRDVLSRLYRRSLVDYDPQTERYSLHDLVRVFALQKLRTAGADAEVAIRLRHAEGYLQVAQQADMLFQQGGSAVGTGLALFDGERAHIDAAWTWLLRQPPSAETDKLMLAYGAATVRIGTLRYHPRLHRIPQWEAVLAAARRLQNRGMEGAGLTNLGKTYADLGEPGRAIGYHEQALTIAHDIGNREAEGDELGRLGNAYWQLGEARTAIGYLEQTLAIALALGDRQTESAALGNLGNAYTDLGEPRRAIGYHEQVLAIALALGDRQTESAALGNLGKTYADLGEARTAVGYLEQALTIALALGDRQGEGYALGNLGHAYAVLGEYATAVDVSQQAYAVLAAIESPAAEQARANIEAYQRHVTGERTEGGEDSSSPQRTILGPVRRAAQLLARWADRRAK